ncbi:MAG: nucleotidyltransferase family protein [Candidatus Omnitrophota bacterium]
MKALILAAGYATRLYPLTKEYPKPLLEINKRPLIDYILEKIEHLKDITEIIIVTNSKFIAKFRDWKKRVEIKKKLSIVNDLTYSLDDRRGAIGDIAFVIEKKRIKDDLLVIGGDNLFDADIKSFVSFAKNKKSTPVIGVYDIKDRTKTNKYGVIKLDNENKIIDFKEKPKSAASTLVAMCFYYFPKNKLGAIKEYLNSQSNKRDATGFYIDWLRKREDIYGYIFTGNWYDIGDVKFYHEAKEKFIN